jgi:ATP-dependent exoDNAse (exonuclease V) alpha subunit
MLLHNYSVANNWVNGTIAQVKSMSEDAIQIQRADGTILGVERITRFIPKTSYSRSQFPLVLSFGSTIHKVQSLTLDAVAVCLDHNFLSHGQLYTACSRVRKLESLYFFSSRGNSRLSVELHFISFIYPFF